MLCQSLKKYLTEIISRVFCFQQMKNFCGCVGARSREQSNLIHSYETFSFVFRSSDSINIRRATPRVFQHVKVINSYGGVKNGN